MKANFKGNSKLIFISLLIMVLCSLVLKKIFLKEDVSYYNNEVYRTIKTRTITEIINQDLEDVYKRQVLTCLVQTKL